MSEEFLLRWRPAIEAELDRLLPAASTWPAHLHQAIRHSVFAGGKRLRPVLALAAAGTCGGNQEAILPAACGLEMIHTYSLIHDDLPALDDDDWRRGVPTCHKAFGEATAILAGDALLTHGLGCLSKFPTETAYDAVKVSALSEVVAAIGTAGMIGGQMEDLEAEQGKATAGVESRSRLELIHRHKTGALIRASLLIGGILSFAVSPVIEALGRFGEKLGLAFQIKDDLLDVESSRETLGKDVGKDSGRGKLTFPGVYGVSEARRILAQTIGEAQTVARALEPSGGPLVSLAEYVSRRIR